MPENDPKQRDKARALIWLALLLSAAAVVVAFVVRRWRRRVPPRPALKSPAQLLKDLPVQGLTEDEAAARQSEGQDNVIYVKPPRTKEQIWRENAYNVFNLNLLGLALAQLLLGRPLDALLSVGTIALNIGINVFQEMFARRRIREVEQAARPQATVIRDEKARSIDPSQIVVGDLVVIGPGDQFLVDGEVVGEGQVVVDESVLTGNTTRRRKRAGDPVYAGSFCVGGHGAVVAQRVGDQRLIASRMGETQEVKQTRTRLERTMERIMWILLAVVAVFTVSLLLAYFRLDIGVPTDTLNDIASVIFSIAPASLFFMIVLTYAAGTADLAKVGALVHQARSVESLAEATVICFAKAGILTGKYVEIETMEPVEGQEQMAESRLRQILGDYARSTSVKNLATQSMAEAFEGNRRLVREEAPFLSVYGWSAVAFDDEDLEGVYVLGSPEVMAALESGNGQPAPDQKGGALPLPDVRKMFAPVGRLFRRSKEESGGDGNGKGSPLIPEGEGQLQPGDRHLASAQETASWAPAAASPAFGAAAGTSTPGATTTVQVAEPVTHEGNGRERSLFGRLRGRLRPADRAENTPAADTEEDGRAHTEASGFLGRMTRRVRHMLRRGGEEKDSQESVEEPPAEETVLLFAYSADYTPLHTPDGTARMPADLVPLCKLHISERVRPEAIETIRIFSKVGVDIKVFTAGTADETVASLRQAGLTSGEKEKLPAISGPELATLDADQLAKAARETTVFGQVTPEEAGQVVAALRAEGESVVVVGDGASDLAAMRQANLAISRQSSTQAALGLADIVLLGDSPAVLSRVLEKGQRIVNGLLDVLKVQLTQVSYLALLILAIQTVAHGFPYQSAQGTIIAVVTVALPSVGLSLWAVSGVLPSTGLGRLLAHTVIPAAVTMSGAALIVYLHILSGTGDIPYAQLVVTWTLVVTGSLLVVLIKPPWPTRVGGVVRAGDPKPAALSLILLVLFVLVTALPVTERFLKTTWLSRPEDYLLVAAVSFGWLITLSLIWRAIPLVRRVRPEQ